jgi:hypothetical protein
LYEQSLAQMSPREPQVREHLIGTIAEVHGPVVDITCNQLPPLHQALPIVADGGARGLNEEVEVQGESE